jgi:uncharacterized protein (TIGR02145 family)
MNVFLKNFSILCFLLLSVSSCEKSERPIEIETGGVISSSSTSITVTGNIIDLGEGILTYGHELSTNSTFTMDLKTTMFSNPTDTGTYISTINFLTPNTYYIRAYATGSNGTVYGESISFTIVYVEPQKGTFIDIRDNQEYDWIKIGDQVWMAENLKATKYNDGSSIPLVTDNTEWGNLTTPGYCWYGNDESKKTPYGALYNWYVVNEDNLCPTGWHVPSDAEWTMLTTYLGGELVTGGKLKSTDTTYWFSPNTGATNESGFTALPGGWRTNGGTFPYFGKDGGFWSSTECSTLTISAWFRDVSYNSNEVWRSYFPKVYGFSVRCLKD